MFMNNIQHFIGISLPRNYAFQVIEFQRKWVKNALPNVVEPHITVKSQAGLGEDLKWIQEVTEICGTFSTFELSLTGINTFGDSVVFLGVESSKIHQLHRRLVNAISPDLHESEKYFELDRYVPHLSLGTTEFGMNEVEIRDMRESALNTFTEPYTFTVSHLSIYESRHGSYKPIDKLKFA